MPAQPNSASPRRAIRALVSVLLIAAFVLAGSGCRLGGPRNFQNENDRLRRENMELQRQVEQLSQRLEQRLGELDNLRQQLERADAEPMPDVDPPTLARIEMGRYSGGVDTDDDGLDDLLRIYLRPLDQHGRVLPVAGRARLQAVAIPDAGEPIVLARRTYEPEAFNRAWRSGFTGQHYTLELELPETIPPDVTETAVRVTFTQARTGVEMTTQRTFRIRRP